MTLTPLQPPENPYEDLEPVMPEAIRDRLIARARNRPPAAVQTLPAGKGRLARRAGLPGRRRLLAHRTVCGAVRVIAEEMVFLTGAEPPSVRNRRFASTHVQQIAMYVCHVALQLTMTDIAAALGKDRTTVGHACARVEDRRDDRGYDTLVGAVERVVTSVFAPQGAE